MSLRLYSPFSVFGADFDDLFAPTEFLLTKPSTAVTKKQKEQNSSTETEAQRNDDGNGNNNNVGSMWRVFQPGMQFHEDDTNYSVSIDLPGVKASDLSLKLEDNGKTVHLSGHRKLQSSDGKSVSESKFMKRFTIGENVDIDKLSADLSDGVLTLSAPKKAPTTPSTREIKITTTTGGNV